MFPRRCESARQSLVRWLLAAEPGGSASPLFPSLRAAPQSAAAPSRSHSATSPARHRLEHSCLLPRHYAVRGTARGASVQWCYTCHSSCVAPPPTLTKRPPCAPSTNGSKTISQRRPVLARALGKRALQQSIRIDVSTFWMLVVFLRLLSINRQSHAISALGTAVHITQAHAHRIGGQRARKTASQEPTVCDDAW